jgi:MFS family permease
VLAARRRVLRARLPRLRGHRRLHPAPLALCFALAGIGIGCAETAEHAAVASLAPEHVRGSAFGVLAGVQSLGNPAASAIAGLLYTVASPAAAFAYAAALTAAAPLVLVINGEC